MPRFVQIAVFVVVLAFFFVDLLDIFFDFMYEWETSAADKRNQRLNKHKQKVDNSKSEQQSAHAPRQDEKAPVKKATQDLNRKMALSEGFLVAIDRLDLHSVRTLLKNPLVDVNYENLKHTALFRLLDQEENEKTLAILSEIIKRPELAVNGNGRTWSPLKMALSHLNAESVKILLQHPQMKPFVFSSGLSCASADIAPEEVVFVNEPDAMSCFQKHPNTMTESEYMQLFPPAQDNKNTAPSGSVAAKTKEGGGFKKAASGGKTQSGATTSYPPNSLVMNPSEHKSIYSAFFTYVSGGSVDVRMVGVWSLFVTTHCGLLVLILLLAVLADLKRKEDIAADNAAAAQAQAAPVNQENQQQQGVIADPPAQ